MKNETEDQDQSIPKSKGTLTVLTCIFSSNLEILTSIGGDLSRRQTKKAQNKANVDFKGKFDLVSQGQSLHKTVETLTKVFCTFVPNLVITHTDTYTHTQTQAMKIPEGQNRPWVKMNWYD